MKKAYLVTFMITTRVIVEDKGYPLKDDAAWNDVVSEACSNLYEQTPDFAENVHDIEEDTECPYGSFEGE